MRSTHQIESTMQGLIETCRDGQKGFETAAKAANDSLLKAELMQYSMQREGFAAALETALKQATDEPLDKHENESGSVSGALHRGWMNLKAAIASNDRYAILAECERGEDSAVEAYRDAISSHPMPTVESLLESQYEQVQRVHNRIKELRDSAKQLH